MINIIKSAVALAIWLASLAITLALIVAGLAFAAYVVAYVFFGFR